MTFTAQIVTRIGDPCIVIMRKIDPAEDDPDPGDPLAEYPLTEERCRQEYPDVVEDDGWHRAADLIADDVLRENGWQLVGEPTSTDFGTLVDVRPENWQQIIAAVTFERDKAAVEYDRQDDAWRTLIRSAVHADESATEIARWAGVSRERIYQIRDDRR